MLRAPSAALQLRSDHFSSQRPPSAAGEPPRNGSHTANRTTSSEHTAPQDQDKTQQNRVVSKVQNALQFLMVLVFYQNKSCFLSIFQDSFSALCFNTGLMQSLFQNYCKMTLIVTVS